MDNAAHDMLHAPPLPDTFVLGAPKCGTTALTRYLDAHPQLFVAERKDIHFFGADLDFRNRPRETRQRYLERFSSDHAVDAVRRVDSSVWYLYSRSAVAEMAAFHPDARAIALIRHPVDAMYALWSQLRLNGLGDETIDDFGEAVAAEPDRRRGLRIPPHTPLPSALLYREVVSFSQQLSRAFEALGRDRVFVVVQEEMKTDTEGTLRALFDWLGVRSDVEIDTRPVNTAKAVRSESVRKLLRLMPGSMKRAVPAGLRQGLSKRLRGMNARHEKRQPLSDALRRTLDMDLAEEISRVEAVLGRPIPSWRTADGASVAAATTSAQST